MTGLHGFVMLHRKILEWEWYAHPTVSRVFIHLLLLASFKEARWQGKTLQPGELITSYQHLADALGLGTHQVRTALEKLESTGEIVVSTTNKYTKISIRKWHEYQGFEEETEDKGQTSGNQATDEGQHRNNVNNDNNFNKFNNGNQDVGGYIHGRSRWLFTPSCNYTELAKERRKEWVKRLEEEQKKKATADAG